MRTIQSGHDVLSLFGIGAKTQALTKKIPELSLVKSLVGAFLIVLLAGLLLSLAQKAVSGSSTSVTTDYHEAVAFVPGQFVSNQIDQINQGYISR